MKKKIIMTGGGSAGHVTPNLALIPKLKEHGYEIEYIGTKEGIERKIIEEADIKYHLISSGKLRRYFDLKNFSDPFKVIKGVFEAKNIIKKVKPDVVFSKGGFVSVPVVIGAHMNKIPVITHESDITPGLANKISAPFCTKICVTFPESLSTLNPKKAILTGTPIRKEIFEGSKIKGKKICGFSNEKDNIFIIGGSLGSKFLNDCVRNNLNELLNNFNIIHICGKGNIDDTLINIDGYKQFEYVSKELPHLFALADIFISRAGANAIYEILSLRKPNILIPLSQKASRGDQILNAESFKKSGYSVVIKEEELTDEILLQQINALNNNKSQFIQAMNKSAVKDSVKNIVDVIIENSNNR